MAIARTFGEAKNAILDNLGFAMDQRERLQESTLWHIMNQGLMETHSAIIGGGGTFYNKITALLSATKDETVATGKLISIGGASSPTFLIADLHRVLRIWKWNTDSSPNGLEKVIPHRLGADEAYMSWEIINNELYWAPKAHDAFSYKIEYDRSPTLPTGFGDDPDIPKIADPYFVFLCTAKASPILGVDPAPWLLLSQQAKRELITTMSWQHPAQRRVAFGSYF